MSTATVPVSDVGGVIRIGDSNGLRTLHVVVLFIAGAVIAGGGLVLSAAESERLVDGAVEWQANSPLRALVQVLCLNYEFPTIHAGEIKNYLLGIGTGLAVLALTIATLSRSQGGDSAAGAPYMTHAAGASRSVAAVTAAQTLVLLYLLWSFASSRWSSAPILSIGATVLISLQFLWALGLAHGLNPTAVRVCARAIGAILAVTAAVAVWYYYRRNPVLPAKFPIGNPSFLAACLIPGIILSATALIDALDVRATRARIRRVLLAGLAIAGIAACAWAFVLARSRGPAVGLVFGALAVAFFALRGRWRVIPVALGLALIAGGAWYLGHFMDVPSPTGRSATMRFRLYAWSYAGRMFASHPIVGHGQGGFILHGDSYAVADVLDDPLAFVARTEHAHCEWLEILSDLGLVGGLLMAGVIGLTLVGGARVLRTGRWGANHWTVIGLLGALVGLTVEEFFGVGLRVAGVPTFFYTIVGLIWAACIPGESPLLRYAASTPNRRISAGVIGGIVGLAALTMAQQDFYAARDAYRTVEFSNRGEDEQAVKYAAASLFRLNPQRVLENTARLVEANLRAADRMAERGMDRSRRAVESRPPDPRLQFLAAQDLQSADVYLKAANQGLKQLVSASPGFINSGFLESRINILEAHMAALRENVVERDAFLKNAAAAVEREIARQPYNPRLAVEYVRLAGPDLAMEQILDVLARPLRHNRIQEPYVELLFALVEEPSFLSAVEEAGVRAKAALRSSAASAQERSAKWAAEKLRLAGAVRFIRGDFAAAPEELSAACAAYDGFVDAAPIGAASCYAEWADVAFFADPERPSRAIELANRSIQLAPSSEVGRDMRRSVEQRLIHYYLADEKVPDALRLLRQSAPAGVTEDIVDRERGIRMRRLCESLVRQRHDLLKSPDGARMLERIRGWMEQSMARSPPDGAAHYLAAEIAIVRKDAAEAARQLAMSRQNGVPPGAVKALLDRASDEGVTNAALDGLRQSIEQELAPASPPTAQPRDDAGETHAP